MNGQTGWRTISEVNINTIFNKVNIGDEVAILQSGQDFWWLGKVLEINSHSDRDTRFQKRPTLLVECFDPVLRTRTFYEECVEEILFKD